MPILATAGQLGSPVNASSLGNLEWLCAGNDTMYYSREAIPTRWYQIATTSFGTTNMNWIATDGAGTWVAVGDSGKLASSTDGYTWTQRTSGFSTTTISWVAYGNGTWVAVGGSGKLSTSTDAVTWTAVTTATSGWSSSYTIGHVAYGNGNWVGVNSNGTLKQTTTPGGAWTTRTEPLGTGQHYAEYHPAIGAGIWTLGVEIGTATDSLASSTDAQTWTARTPATGSTADTLFTTASNSTCILAGSKDSSAYVLQKSTNGTFWTAVTEPSTFNASAIVVRGANSNLQMFYSGTDAFLGWNFCTGYTTTDGSTFTANDWLFYDTNNNLVLNLPDIITIMANRYGHQSIR